MQRKASTKTKAKPSPITGRIQKKLDTRRASKANASSARPTKITGAFRILRDSISMTRQYWKIFFGIMAIYFVLSLFLVGGVGGDFNIAELRQTTAAELGEVATTVALYGLLLGSAVSVGSEAGSAYLGMLLVVVSLATIWALRQLMGGKSISAKQAFYKGMTPLVPFILVLAALALTLLPMLLAGFLFSVIFGNALAVTMAEYIGWGLAIGSLVVLSVYIFTTYMFGVYIVTLPDMRPVAALRSARLFIRYRRLMVIRKVLFLPFVYVLISAAIFLPLIALIPPLVQPLFVAMTLYGFVLAHVYFYSLYKEML